MIDSMTKTILGVYDVFAKKLTELFQEKCTSIFSLLLADMGEGLSAAWENPIIKVFMDFSNMVGFIILVMSLPFFLLKITQEEKRNWFLICKFPTNALLFVFLNQFLVRGAFLISDTLATTINVMLAENIISTALDTWMQNVGIFLLFVFVIAAVMFFFLTVIRFGEMFVQMMLAPLYVPFVLMGNHQKVMEWVMGIVGISCTYLLQYITFFSGVVIVLNADSNIWNAIVGCSLVWSTFGVSKIMARFGLTSGASPMGVLMSGVNMLTSFTKIKI